jgi:hypothetical protein
MYRHRDDLIPDQAGLLRSDCTVVRWEAKASVGRQGCRG